MREHVWILWTMVVLTLAGTAIYQRVTSMSSDIDVRLERLTETIKQVEARINYEVTMANMEADPNVKAVKVRDVRILRARYQGLYEAYVILAEPKAEKD